MNLITDTWRGLVRRKLWPVALLLVGALVAVPLVLAKAPEVEPAPPANAAAAASDEGIPVTYVKSADDEELEAEETGKRRRTLGDSKDPFEPAPLPKAKKKKAKQADATDEKSSSEKSGSDDAKTDGGGATAPTAPVATATPAPTPKPAPANSIRVRFTKVNAEGETPVAKSQLFRRLEVLPDEANPVVVFQGLEKGGKLASFELTGNVTVEGDGDCEPTPEICGTLTLRVGETAFITVSDTGNEETDAQYQLDLVKINK